MVESFRLVGLHPESLKGFFFKMVKLTKRKGFNFFRSYFDVYNELENDADKVAFMDALLDRQFLGIKPLNITGMAKFAYISQTNSIDSQVKGYEDKTKTRLDGTVYVKDGFTPTDGVKITPTDGGKVTPTEQVEEKEKEKEKVKEKLITTTSELKNIEIVIDNKEFSEHCLSNKQWIEVLSMQNRVSEDVINLFLSHFDDHLITMQEQKKSLKEYKSHFVHWFNKQDLSQFRKKVIGKTNQI